MVTSMTVLMAHVFLTLQIVDQILDSSEVVHSQEKELNASNRPQTVLMVTSMTVLMAHVLTTLTAALMVSLVTAQKPVNMLLVFQLLSTATLQEGSSETDSPLKTMLNVFPTLSVVTQDFSTTV